VVRALDGVQDARALGDTVIINDTEAAKEIAGIRFHIEMARQFAAVNPAVATALLSFHPDYRTPGLPINLLRGAVASPGIPTEASFELVVAQVRDKERFTRSLTPLDPGRYLQVRWNAIEIDSDTLEVTFFTEIIDEDSRSKDRAKPNAVMLVSKSTKAVLSLTQE
jgi:hypothetical protein